jgi:hypothetical protein
MVRIGLLLLVVFSMFACKPKKANLAGDEPVEADDFIASFQELKLPYIIGDTALTRKTPDAQLIGKKVLKQFVPDTIYNRDFGKGSSPKFYALGSVPVKDGETYLFIKATTAGKTMAYILCYDKDLVFKTGMPVLNSSTDRSISYEGGMDRRYSIIRNRSRKKPDGQVIYNKSVYVYNSAGVFTLILTESNQTVEENVLYNPIDTLARKNTLSGNYIRDKKNLITIRDGAKPGQLKFFIHIDKNDGDCTGELKGDLDLVKPNLAQYRKADDHCALEFSFTPNSVTIRELEACGNHRGIKCAFEGSYPKKKEAKKPVPKPVKKK